MYCSIRVLPIPLSPRTANDPPSVVIGKNNLLSFLGSSNLVFEYACIKSIFLNTIRS